MRKLGSGSDGEEQGLKGKKGRWDTKGVKVRRGTSRLLCPSHPLTAALLLLAAVEGASAHVVIVQTEKNGRKVFRFIFLILHSTFSQYLVSISVCGRASIYLSMCVLQCKRENKIMHFAG